VEIASDVPIVSTVPLTAATPNEPFVGA